MKGITPPPFIDRHGVDPHGIVYVCPAATCRQPHETREAYLAHWDTVHRQLDKPRDSVNSRVVGGGISVSDDQAANLTRYPELLALLIGQIRERLTEETAKLDGTPGEFIELRILAERIVFTEEETTSAQG